ncbi:MAG: LCP family protein [Candidatus Moranbacteria bacterium]|nr:LCP family protein [Candidatus Moranbacteria bacterium]MDD3964747.1 LCP family protein [Candidatus Moranbacteria bacterium]
MDSLQKHSHSKKSLIPSQKTLFLPHETEVSAPQITAPELFYDFSHKKHRPRHSWKKPVMIFFALFFTFFSLVAFLLFSKGISIGRTIQLDNTASPSFLTELKHLASSFITRDNTLLDGKNNGRINILLLGRAGEKYPGRNLTDTVMLMSIDTTQKKVALLSLPRDLYVPIPETSLFIKINSLYQYGISNDTGITPLRTSVETITHQKIHYSFVLDFDGFEKVVDALGGISIDVVRDFYDPRYPGKNYSYETFEIKKGWQTLDGATTLKYVRERHNDPEGDFGRAKRQQQVIQTIRDKAFSLGTAFNFFAVRDLLDALGESVQTDMSLEEMEHFLQLVRTLDTKNITSVVIDAWKMDSLLRVSHIQVGPTAMFILVPRIGNWSEIQDVSEHLFDLDTLHTREQMIQEEDPTVTIIVPIKEIALAEKMKDLLETIGFQSVNIISSRVLNTEEKESIIQDTTGMSKPYSLDELIRKFSLKKEDSSENLLEQKSSTSDFVITLGEDIREALAYDEEKSVGEIPDDAVFPEMIAPQEKIKKKN